MITDDSMDSTERVRRSFQESIHATSASMEALAPVIAEAAAGMASCLLSDHRILCCGNGGSAASAQHFASKMLVGYEIERPGLPAFALSTDGAVLTALADAHQFDEVFARQVRAIGQPGDMLLAISSGGEAASVTRAIDAAHARDMQVVLLSGGDGGPAAERLGEGDLEIRVPLAAAARVQEVHLTAIHCLCDLIDQQLLGQEI